jgi:hypothetical protein
MLLAAVLALSVPPVAPDLPNRQPQLAATPAAVALALGAGQSIWVARSTDNGRAFGEPVKVADVPKLMLGRHRGPRVAISGNAMVVSAIGGDGNLASWRSTDNGRTWSKGPVINDAPQSAREGLHAMAADSSGRLAAVWLDLRAPGSTRLYGAFSRDAGATWSKNVELYDGSICECCHPSLIATGADRFTVMWRNNLDGSRDLYTRALAGGKPAGPAVKQGQGTWKLQACPMDGGGVAGAVTAWRREKDIYLARPGQPELKVGPGQDVAIAANAKGEYLVWTNAGAVDALLPGDSAPRRLAGKGAFPSIVALPGGAILAAWEENGAIQARRLE